jgi:LDH2 family malate/lactate/ureidoglycolate dehydrogenase
MAEPIRAHPGKLHYYVREVFKRLRVPPRDASRTADVLVAADLAGIETEGVARLLFYVNRLSSRLVNRTPRVRVVSEVHSAATLDGDNGLGPVLATSAMELAIRKAERSGVGVVAVRNSNHFGMAGYYARLALSKDMIGLALSNGYPAVVPPGHRRPLVGSNPLAIAAPALSGPPFVLDMCTSAASLDKLEEARRLGREIPEGWGLDAAGKPTTDPAVALKALRLVPLGGTAQGGGHKGFGLALAVDVLCGVLSGGAFGQELSGAWGERPAAAKIGHLLAAVRIRAFGPLGRFKKRLDEMLVKLTRFSEPRLFYPGEPEHEAERERRANGILLPADVALELERLARSLGLEEAWEQLLSGRGSEPSA